MRTMGSLHIKVRTEFLASCKHRFDGREAASCAVKNVQAIQVCKAGAGDCQLPREFQVGHARPPDPKS